MTLLTNSNIYVTIPPLTGIRIAEYLLSPVQKVAWSLTPAPAEGGAGSKRTALGCDPGAGCSAAMARVLTCAYTVASPETGAPAPRFGAPLPSGEGKWAAEMEYQPFPETRMDARSHKA